MLTLGSSWCSKWNKKLTPCLHAWNHLLYFQVSCQQQLTYVDPVKTFYALNPQNNLPNTQKMFQKWFERYELWNTQIVEQLKEERQFCSLFGTFWWRPFHQYNVKPRVENVYWQEGHKYAMTNFSLLTWIQSLRIHLQGNSPTFRNLRKAK